MNQQQIIQKHAELIGTFTENRGKEIAIQALLDVMLKDAVENEMIALREKTRIEIARKNAPEVDPYETAAQAFYRKYGTRGEF